ncbi:MAG: Flp pilus assembly complex ATPase component TadA, partial [Candidatus Eremiobacteraeota bacterium]|nr:Flp pilus assembly complex ATPase component TadA [Candidatus Eremiobacteraeota bacterium]
IAERRLSQDGRYSLASPDSSVDVRVSTMPTMCGEKIVLRLMRARAVVPRLEQLGMSPGLLDRYRRLVAQAHGFIVACGPTGSGKTTTLYASLAERNVVAQNLCSVEDPVEIRLAGVSQVQINVRAGVTFPAVLRSFLRQDPNVIMIGELRDSETANAGVAAALSGQMVLTTLHSRDVTRTFERFDELGVSRSSLAASLSAVLSQRLVRMLCQECRTRLGDGYEPMGCESCDGTGFRGRCAIFELLIVDDCMRDAIARGEAGARIALLSGTAPSEGLRAEGSRLVRAGRTSTAELHRVLGAAAK